MKRSFSQPLGIATLAMSIAFGPACQSNKMDEAGGGYGGSLESNDSPGEYDDTAVVCLGGATDARTGQSPFLHCFFTSSEGGRLFVNEWIKSSRSKLDQNFCSALEFFSVDLAEAYLSSPELRMIDVVVSCDDQESTYFQMGVSRKTKKPYSCDSINVEFEPNGELDSKTAEAWRLQMNRVLEEMPFPDHFNPIILISN